MTMPATSTATQTGQDALTYVEQNFPQFAWMLSVPELASTIINQIVTPGITDPNQIQAIIQNTQWWQTTGSAARAFIQLEETDQASAQQQFTQQKAAISATFAQLGLNPTDMQLSTYAYASLMNGWSTQQLVQQIGQSITVNQDGSFSVNGFEPTANAGKGTPMPAWLAYLTQSGTAPAWTQQQGTQPQGGALLSSEQQLQNLSKQYLVNMSPQVLGQWSEQIATGQSTQAGFQSYLQNTALGQYPWMAQGIQEGQTPLQLVNPYANMVSNELGVSPNEIDWTQPQWSKLLSQTDPKTGQVVQTPLWQATNELRSNPSYGWQNTPNARDAVYSMIQGLQQTLGFRNYSGTSVSTPGSYQSGG